MDWKPIETAPRDGTPVVVYDGIGVCEAVYDADMTFDEFKLIADDDEGEAEWAQYVDENPGMGWTRCEPVSGDVTYLNPIAWMPLPEPPQ